MSNEKPSKTFADKSIYERSLEDEKRYEYLVVIEDVWRNHFTKIAEISKRIRHEATRYLEETSKSYNDQLKCGKLIAETLEGNEDSYIPAVKCFGELLAQKRLKLYERCIEKKLTHKACYVEFKQLEDYVSKQLTLLRDDVKDPDTRYIYKYCENEAKILGFTDEREKLVMDSCLIPKFCENQYQSVVKCFLSGHSSEKCQKEVENMFECYFSKHWNEVKAYHKKLDSEM